MGISRNLAINIEGNRSVMQVPLTIYYMDRGIDLLFEIKNMDYMFSGNMLENLDNAEVSIIIIKPNGRVFRTSKAQIENNLVKLTITKEFTDELDEIGTYQLQFQFYSNEGQDRITIPPINFNVVELIAPIDDSQEQGQVDYAFTDVAQVSTKKGGEITARWVTQEYITADKLNLMQENGEKGKAALEEVKKARGEEEDLNSRLTTIESASKITNQTLGEVKKEVETARGNKPNLNARLQENETNTKTINTEIENARGEEDSLVERLNNSDKKASDIEKELKIARGSYETLPNRLDTEEKHFYDSIAKINKEIGYRLEEGENITINHTHEGMMSNTEILGNTKYKRKDNSLTDVWEEGVTLESTGEAEKKLIKIKSCGKNLAEVSEENDTNFPIGYIRKGIEYTLRVKRRKNIPFNLKLNSLGGKAIKNNIYSNSVKFTNLYENGILYYNAHSSDTVTEIFLTETESPSPTPYEPYQGDAKQIQLPNPLRKVGDVADRIYEKDGKVWLEQNIGVVALNGRENWVVNPGMTNSGKVACYIKLENKKQHVKNSFMCDILKIGAFGDTNVIVNELNASTLYAILKTESLTTFREWFSENPTTVLYQLETPITTELDISNIDLKSYDNITHIMSDNNISPTIKTDVPYTLKDTIEGLYTKEQANVEFDRVYEILNLNSYAPYKGENISIKHSKMGRTKDTEILGNTIKSKNLFDTNKVLYEFIVKNSSGKLNIIDGILEKNIRVDKAKTYVFSYKSNVKGFNNVKIIGCDEEMGSKEKTHTEIYMKAIELGGEEFKTLNSQGDIYYGIFTGYNYINITTGGTFSKDLASEGSNVTFSNLQLEEGKEPTPYLPYGYLKSTSEEEENKIEILSCGKNLFDIDFLVRNGELEKGEDGYYTNITKTQSYFTIKLDKSKSYFCVGETTNDNAKESFNMLFEDENGRAIKDYYFYDGKQGVSVQKASTVRFRYPWNTPDRLRKAKIKNVMLCESPIQIPYEPYIEDKKTIQLPHPLRAVGDVKDKIYEKDGKIWLEQNIGKIVLNGTEKWGKRDFPNQEKTILFALNIKNDLRDRLNDITTISDTYFKNVSGNTLYSTDKEGIGCADLLEVKIEREKLSQQNEQGFKEWLSKNNATVLYQLRTPITTELDVSNIDLNTYSAMTHITSNNNIQSTINCQAPVDKDAINKELQETTLALEKENQKLLNAQNEQVAKDLDLDARMLTIEEAIKGEALTLDLGSVSKYSPYFMMKHCIEYGVYREDDIARKLDLYFRNKRITEEEKINITQLLEEKKNETIEK